MDFNTYYTVNYFSCIKNKKQNVEIIQEIEKTGLPFPESVEKKIKSRLKFQKGFDAIAFIFGAIFLYKVKHFGLLNKISFLGVIYYLSYSYQNCVLNEEIIESLLFSDTYLGQEARIVTKFYHPEHSKIIAIEDKISSFKEKAKNAKEINEIRKQKMLKKQQVEEKSEEDFIKKLQKKLI